MSVEQIIHEALKLSPEDRVRVAERLYDTVDFVEEDAEFAAELDRRCREIDDGTVELIPFDEAMRHIENRLKMERESRQNTSAGA